MTVDALEAGMETSFRRVLLSSDGVDGWTLSCADRPARRFPDIEAALDCARSNHDTKAATIEIWQSGQYICCMPPRPAPSSPGSDGGRVIPYPLLTNAEWYANRAAEATMTRAGPLFWAALIVVAIAASLGWQLL